LLVVEASTGLLRGEFRVASASGFHHPRVADAPERRVLLPINAFASSIVGTIARGAEASQYIVNP